MSQQAILMIANSEVDSNLYYATRFLAPDPFIFIQTNGRKTLVMSDLELDRAKAQAHADTVLAYSQYEQRLKTGGAASPSLVDVVEAVLKELGVKQILVPETFGLRHADVLRSKGFVITTKPDPIFEERVIKTEEEIQAISQTQRAVEAAVEEAIEVLREATVKKDVLYWKSGTLTSETLKKVVNVKLMELDCVAQHTIIAGGIQGCDPHNEGSGPLRPNETIVMDVFPRSSTSRYYADMTRTVVKGRASDAVRKLYDTVKEAQEGATGKIKDGADGQAIHQWIMDLFEKKGYHTGMKDGRMQGFFHGTGHGVGLDIHEPPRISRVPWVLKAGEVVTVEPGLYYPEIGAVRIEDMVLVTQNSCINLTKSPKLLEV